MRRALLPLLLSSLALLLLAAPTGAASEPECRETWPAPGMGALVCTDPKDPKCLVGYAIVTPPAEWHEGCIPSDPLPSA